MAYCAKFRDADFGTTALSDAHPKYPLPTIVEATCEIGFVSADDAKFSSRELYKVIGDEFPEMRPVNSLAFQIVLQGNGGVQAPSLNSPPPAPFTALRYGTSSDDRFVQIGQGSVLYQIVGAPYDGWPTFKEKILDIWAKLKPIAKPQQLAKIGMRYINRIEMSANHPHLESWLKPSIDLPESLIKSKGHFFGRLESSPELDCQKLITIAPQADPKFPQGAIIFDIDCILTSTNAADDKFISAKLEVLHDRIWSVFNAAKTDVLTAKLNGE